MESHMLCHFAHNFGQDRTIQSHNVKRLKECHEKYSKTYDLHFANELSAAYIPPANAYNLMDFGKAMASTTTAMKTFLQALPRDQNTKQTSSGTYVNERMAFHSTFDALMKSLSFVGYLDAV
ncbi:uncharacterized protein LOC131879900 [Tigriopus californicus]|uniref:uncharacterized protein LOC131879900 n=1 Tax=Tigriopus californicus TaxID=6832 RepID=UPI0027D9E646|nr:uncharacterized protein LOC131879900 [Tigriopus californicus]